MALTKTKFKGTSGSPKSPVSDPRERMSPEDLEMAAYFHWLGRGCPSDDALTDWIEVEKKWGDESISKKMDVQA